MSDCKSQDLLLTRKSQLDLTSHSDFLEENSLYKGSTFNRLYTQANM